MPARVAAALALGLLSAGTAWGRPRFVLKTGAFYDTGDFGTSERFETLVIPATLRAAWSRFDLGVTASVIHTRASRAVTILDGGTTPAGERRTERRTRSGPGDTLVKARVRLTEDPGPEAPLPAVSALAKVKLPTAGEDLGTGELDYGFGLELDKELALFFVFADASYTVIGKPRDRSLRDRQALSFGAGLALSRRVDVSAGLDWRRSIVAGVPDPLEAFLALRLPAGESASLNPSAFMGLSDGSPEWGAGLILSLRLGAARRASPRPRTSLP